MAYDFLVGNTYFTIIDRSPGVDPQHPSAEENGVYDPGVDQIQVNDRSRTIGGTPLDLTNAEHTLVFQYVSQALGVNYPPSFNLSQQWDLFNHLLRGHSLRYAQAIFQRRDNAREAARMGNCLFSFREFTEANRIATFNVSDAHLFPRVSPQVLISLQTFFSPNGISQNPIAACYGENHGNYYRWINTPPPPPAGNRPNPQPSAEPRFGGMNETGLDNQPASGNMNGDGPGTWGGPGVGRRPIGMGTLGPGDYGTGTGAGQGYGSGAGAGLRGRGTDGPTVRAVPWWLER